jgi:hypothetical protein
MDPNKEGLVSRNLVSWELRIQEFALVLFAFTPSSLSTALAVASAKAKSDSLGIGTCNL